MKNRMKMIGVCTSCARDHKPLKNLRRYAICDVRFVVWEARPRLPFDTHAQCDLYTHMHIDSGNAMIQFWPLKRRSSMSPASGAVLLNPTSSEHSNRRAEHGPHIAWAFRDTNYRYSFESSPGFLRSLGTRRCVETCERMRRTSLTSSSGSGLNIFRSY